DLEGGRLALERLVRDQDGIETRGRIVQLQLGQLLPPSAVAGRLNTDMQLSGEWDLRYREELNGFLRLQRDRGDITVLGAAPVALGLGALRANVQADGGRIALDFEAAGERLGTIALDASTQLGDGTNALALPDHAPLSGRARLDMPSLAWVGALIDPILRTDGRLKGDVSVGGSVAQPAISGRIHGEALQFAHAELGLDLRRGRLDSEFSGERLNLRALEFEGAQGRLHLAGPIDFGRNPVADLMLQAEQFAVLNRPDRRLVLSGKTRLEWRDARSSAVGSFSVDSGFFDIGTADRPTLGEDVVIVGRDDQEQARATALAMDIQVRLGNGVVVRGRGLDAVLGGQVRLLSDAGEPLQAVGTLRVSKGTFSAYGRELAIEQGAVRFNGALNNPALDILAMRRGQEVEAGVSVQGTVLAPRVTLVSEPAVPDAEKLAWLVLGRSLANAGAEDIGSLQEAAASLLTRGAAAGVQSRIASAFGLDTFSVGTTDDTLQERIVKVGKQLSSRLYLGYEHGLESAAGVLQLRYLLTPSLSLEAETGARSAFSLFYNLSFD
ncbi:MAG TPA: translocation/assembly module TamB domain-containing protein, partial [Noviherbaspirillum sp.]